MKNSTSTKNTSKKSSARTSRQINEAAPLGSRENPYKSSIRLKGRSFVMDETGEWREMDQDGNLIPDEEVKPL